MKIIDLRSDSVTRPTPEMRQAMYEAEVGYDVFHDDPTVNRLEALACEMTGLEAAMFVPTGTMGNQLAILTFTRRGDEIILSSDSHILEFEVGAASVISSVGYRAVFTPDGILRKADIESAIRPEDDIHVPRTGLVCLENALGRGTVLPLHLMREAYETAKEHGLPVHTDGARVFNACAAMGMSIRELGECTDSLVIHLSKGLCAPIGSLLLGPKEFIEYGRRNRHMLGGGMSQTGILAAAGIVALTKMTGRLYEDHENARDLARRLEALPGLTVDHSRADINLVFFSIERAPDFLSALPEKLFARNIKISAGNGKAFRFALHHDVTHEDVQFVADTLEELFE